MMTTEPERLHVDVPGLIHIRGALSEQQQRFCVQQIDAAPWSDVLHRRVQHYGFAYDYRARDVGPEDYLGPLPDWLVRVGNFISRETGLGTRWEQAIVNEYRAGVGIGEHTDARPFGPHVASVSLLTAAPLLFRPDYRALTHERVLALPGDILVMTGAARATWTHEIRGEDVPGRRLSITFRTV